LLPFEREGVGGTFQKVLKSLSTVGQKKFIRINTFGHRRDRDFNRLGQEQRHGFVHRRVARRIGIE
jgi:hypothetical protein